MSRILRWGILGTGRIAGIFARGVQDSVSGKLVAVGSRLEESASRFAQEFNIPKAYASYDELLADPEVEAVYIATPHPMHAQWAIRAAEAGKHILCEKPLALNHAEAMAIVEAAKEHDVFLMEAFMYRCHPQTARVVDMIRDGAIGNVRTIQATFSFDAGSNPESRLLRQDLGGGGILDVGCYCTSMARLIAGVALGKDFADPIELKAVGHIGEESRVDEYTAAVLKFPGEIIAQLATGVRVKQEDGVRIYGSDGWIHIPEPWIPGPNGEPTSIFLYKKGQSTPEEIVVDPGSPLYAIEADTVASHIEDRQAPSPAMTWEDSLGNMRTLDMWREQIGMIYDSERPEANTLPVHGRPLRVRPDNKMKYGHVQGIDKPISRLVMGVDNQRTMPHLAVMLDDFFERGGTCFDTAYIYMGGLSEKLLGQWVKNRGIREQVVIIGKGAHTPYCDPENLTKQLLESLDRLQTDYIDLYFMHRDNPEIPVGEFVEVLNEHLRAGRIRAFGGSNWTIQRVEEANKYAREHGLTGFAAVSNNFSLARMIEPPWAGCISSSDPESRAWFERNQMPLFSWSSQARGFFTGRARPDDFSDPELVRCWYSEDNFRRLERVNQLAREKGVEPINIALAYVLSQPFPTFALIGPRALSETHSSLKALEIELTPEEVKWLNLEA